MSNYRLKRPKRIIDTEKDSKGKEIIEIKYEEEQKNAD